MSLRKDIILTTARDLRRHQTKGERLIWQAVRNRKLRGKKFFRQHPIRFEKNGKRCYFIADFYCSEKKLVVEVDGKLHQKQKDYDNLRTYIINILGMKVIRFHNKEVERDIKSVLNKIEGYL